MKKNIFLTGFILSFVGSVHANTDINFKGIVHETPECSINEGNPITVDFGTVDADTVDGVQNTIQIDYAFTCASTVSDVSKWIYGYKLTGTASSFSSSAIITDMEDLGIQISADGVIVAPGVNTLTALEPNGDKPLPVLKATLVKNSGSTLNTGDFSATAGLAMTYY